MYISREGNLVTVINVFETKPAQQQELIDAWLRFVESVKEEPGLIGTALHRSIDETRVVNYAQWRSEEDFESFVKKYRAKDRMAKPYRVTTFVRINNTIITSLLRLGLKVWSFSLLTVRGRKSGKPIVTPVAIFVQDQKRYLIATYGVVNWVRNLRFRLYRSLSVLPYLNVTENSSLEEFEREVLAHPVFLLPPAM
jgi:heme-degrading monooxygenase HmoA